MSSSASSPSAAGIELTSFEAMDAVRDVGAYVAALEAFDLLPELQELKQLARARCGVGPGQFVLDVGCGFGLETFRLARLVAPGGRIAGIDKSADFIAEARRRAAASGFEIEFRAGDAEKLPYADGSFDSTRAERLLIYVPEPGRVIAEMARVTRPGGGIALIEPDFGTTTIGLADRALVRRVMAHESDKAVLHSSLPAALPTMLRGAGFGEPVVSTRVVLMSPKLGADYFSQAGRTAAADGAITADELSRWLAGIAASVRDGTFFGSVGYFLFTATLGRG